MYTLLNVIVNCCINKNVMISVTEPELILNFFKLKFLKVMIFKGERISDIRYVKKFKFTLSIFRYYL